MLLLRHMDHRLQGESPLSQANHTQSSNAYDKSLLNKIGKAPGHARRSSSETDALTRTLSNSTRATPSPLRTGNSSSSTIEANYKWAASPTSASFPATESNKPNWPDCTLLSTTSRDIPSHQDRAYSIRTRGSQTRPSDVVLSTAHLRPGLREPTFDSPVSDREHRWGEADLGNCRISDRPRPSGTQGFKRRALLPSLDTTHDNSHSVPQGAPQSLAQSNHSFSSDLCSTETSLYTLYPRSQNDSPSYLSFDMRLSRDGGLGSCAAGVTGHSPAARPSPHAPSEHLTGVVMPMPAINRNMSSSRIPIQFICTCCPKKPRKFDTEEKLQ